MKINKNQLLEIVDNIPVLIYILGYIGLMGGCAILSIVMLIAIFTGILYIPANVLLLLICIPGLGGPALTLLSFFIIWLIKFFIK